MNEKKETALSLSWLKCSTAFSFELNALYAQDLRKFRTLKMVSWQQKNRVSPLMSKRKRSWGENESWAPWDTEHWCLHQREVPGPPAFPSAGCWNWVHFSCTSGGGIQGHCALLPSWDELMSGKERLWLPIPVPCQGKSSSPLSLVNVPSSGLGQDQPLMEPAQGFCEVTECPCRADQWEYEGRCIQAFCGDLDCWLLMLSGPV